MDNFPNRMGIFPSLMDPARKAAETLMLKKVLSVELEEKPGFLVVLKGTVAQERVFHEFEHEGVWFALIEKEEIE